MAAYVKIADWVEYESKDVDIASDQFAVALTNTAPGAEGTPPTGDGDGVIANITQVNYANCSSRNLTTASHAQAGGTLTLDMNNLTLTASGGTVGPFRYVYVFDDTVAGDPLVGYFDYGSSITLADGETLDININASGLYTKT